MSNTPAASAHCSLCGVGTSHLELLTRRHGAFSPPAYFCPRCWDLSYRKAQRNRFWFWALLGAGGALVALLVPDVPIGLLLLGLVWFEVCQMTSIIPHEFAHAMAARLLGVRVFRVLLGSGPTWWRGSLFGFEVQARTFLFEGAVIYGYPVRDHVRWKRFMIALAGPMANFGLLAVAVIALNAHRFSSQWMVAVFAIANFMLLVTNLFPHQLRTATNLSSDGRQLFDALFRWDGGAPRAYHAFWFLQEARECAEQGRIDDARAWVQRGLTSYPGNDALLTLRARWLIDAGDLKTARKILLRLVNRVGAKAATRLEIKNWIAYADALLGKEDLLREADRYSSEALAAMPWNPAFRSTRGAVLLALGNIDSARPLLRAGAEQARENPDQIAQVHNILAMAEAACGDVTAAETALTAARLAMPRCFLIPRAEAAITAARGPVDQTV